MYDDKRQLLACCSISDVLFPFLSFSNVLRRVKLMSNFVFVQNGKENNGDNNTFMLRITRLGMLQDAARPS